MEKHSKEQGNENYQLTPAKFGHPENEAAKKQDDRGPQFQNKSQGGMAAKHIREQALYHGLLHTAWLVP